MPETIEIKCSGYSIIADWYEGADPRKILLMLPGFTSSRARQKDFVSAVVKQTGMSAIVIDYSGHGDSPFELKDTRPAQHFLEVICAFDWVKEKCPDAEISVAGSSYGSFLATQLTKYREFAKLVLRAPAIYRPNEFYDLWSVRFSDEEGYRKAMDAYRRHAEALAKHPLLARASNFRGKTLVVVHENDELVPSETTNAYISAFDADSFVAKDFTHSVSDSPINQQQLDEYQSHIADWLK
jgi:uncharacterized protein